MDAFIVVGIVVMIIVCMLLLYCAIRSAFQHHLRRKNHINANRVREMRSPNIPAIPQHPANENILISIPPPSSVPAERQVFTNTAIPKTSSNVDASIEICSVNSAISAISLNGGNRLGAIVQLPSDGTDAPGLAIGRSMQFNNS